MVKYSLESIPICARLPSPVEVRVRVESESACLESESESRCEGLESESESSKIGTRVRLESESKDSSPHLCLYLPLTFPADIDRKPRLRRPVGTDNAYTPVRAGFVGDARTPDNETADGLKLRRRYGA